MKKLMRSSLVALSLTVAVLGMVGCNETTNSGNNSTSSETSASSLDNTGVDPTKAVTVTWWNNYQAPEISDTLTEAQARAKPTYREYYYAKDLIDAFHTEHPNITVNQVYKGSYSDIAKAVNTAGASGDTPSMCSVYGDNVAVFDKAGLTLDVSGYVNDANVGFGMKTTSAGKYVADSTTALSDLNQNYLDIEKGMYNGKFLSMPYSKSGETLVVNQTVFDKVGEGECGTSTTNDKGVAVYTAPVAAASKAAYTVPTTWKQMITTARQMQTDFPTLFANQKDADGYFKSIPFCWDSGQNMFISLCKNMGIKYTNGSATKASEQVAFNNADAKKLMVQLKKWNNEGLICTQNQLPITNAAKGYHDYSSNKAVAGTIFMCMSSTAGARYFATNGGFEATLNQPLAIDSNVYDFTKDSTVTSVKNVVSQGPSITFFKKSDVNEERASWEFYKYLTNTTNSATLAKNTAYFPLRTSSYNTDDIKAITAAGTAGTTADANSAAKGNCYTGEALNLNTTYTTDGKFFLSDVFEYSSACRTAVGNIVDTVFNDKTATTDADITTLVENAFNTAYAAVLA